MVKKEKIKCVVCGEDSRVEASCIYCTLRERSNKIKPSRKIQKHFWCAKCFSRCPDKVQKTDDRKTMTFEEFQIEEDNLVKRIMSPDVLLAGISLNAPCSYLEDIEVSEDY